MPPVDKTKQRLGRYVEESLGGPDNVELRGLVTKAVEFAQKVKHDLPSRRDAGITADSVILLANILKRLEQRVLNNFPRTAETCRKCSCCDLRSLSWA